MSAKNRDMLKLMLQRSTEKQRKLLQQSNDDFITFLCECVLNIMEGNVPIDVKKLEKYENSLRILCNPRTSKIRRRKCLLSEDGLKVIKIIGPPCIGYLEF